MKRLFLLFFIVTTVVTFHGIASDPYQEPWLCYGRIDIPQDPAKERLHAQCNALSQAERFSYPAYSIQDIRAQLCSSWSVADFAYVTQCAVQQGGSRHEVEEDLLHKYDLYQLDAFREHIKTFSNHRSYIKELHTRLSVQKGKYYRLLRALGFLDPAYVHKLEMAELLHDEIIKEELAEQRAFQQIRQEATRKIFDEQREELNQLSDEWCEEQDHYEHRRQALAATNQGTCIYEAKWYRVSPEATRLINNTGSDVAFYNTCYGNQIQQVIHQECIDGIDQLCSLSETSIAYQHKESIAQCFDAAREYNQAGAVDKATMVADFCWSLLDYGKAITEGAVEGVMSGVCDIVEHPGQALLCAVAGNYVFAYQLSKVLYNVADIGVTYAFNHERGVKKWDEYTAPMTQLIDAITNKEISLRDGLKGATQFAVQWKTQSKLLAGLNKFCTTAKTKALEFAKNNPLALPEQYMTTPEGILLQSTQNTPASGSHCKYARSSKFFVANQQEISELADKARLTMQPSPEVLQAIGRDLLNAPEKIFKHIFSAELVEKIFPMGKIEKSLSGFHHYIAGHLDEMGIKLINPKTCNKTGLILADVLCNGHLEKRKTFFPTSWSRDKVVEKIVEAIQNIIKPPVVEGTRGVLFGKTSEGIIVRIVVDVKSGNYITAFPDALANGL